MSFCCWETGSVALSNQNFGVRCGNAGKTVRKRKMWGRHKNMADMQVTFFPAARLQSFIHTQSKPMSCCLCSLLLTSAGTHTHKHIHKGHWHSSATLGTSHLFMCPFPKYFTSQLLFHVLSECVCACLWDTQAKGRTKGLRRRGKERKERKAREEWDSDKSKGTRKRKCFVCRCLVRMNASTHRHACLYRVNAHVLVESVPEATQIDREDKQTESFLSQSLPDLHLFHSCCLSHAAAASGGKTDSCLNRTLPCDRQTERETETWTDLI